MTFSALSFVLWHRSIHSWIWALQVGDLQAGADVSREGIQAAKVEFKCTRLAVAPVVVQEALREVDDRTIGGGGLPPAHLLVILSPGGCFVLPALCLPNGAPVGSNVGLPRIVGVLERGLRLPHGGVPSGCLSPSVCLKRDALQGQNQGQDGRTPVLASHKALWYKTLVPVAQRIERRIPNP